MDSTSDRGADANALSPGGMGTAVRLLREQLVDVSKRNRLTNAPVGKGRSKQLDIEDELSDEVFDILCLQGGTMTFEPQRDGSRGAAGGAEFDADEAGERVFVPGDEEPSGPAARRVDTKLQTRLTGEALQKRLLTLYREAQTIEEEQGVSVLFLVLGFLRWYESASSGIERFAPLILLPVDLRRDSVRGRFKLALRDEDMDPNLSLRAMLKADFDLALPDFPEGADWLPSRYFARASEAVSSQPRWEVELTQFCGHLILLGGGSVHDAEIETAVCGGVPAADGRSGPVGARAGGLGSGVRAVGPGDPELGGAGRPGCRRAHRRAAHRRA